MLVTKRSYSSQPPFVKIKTSSGDFVVELYWNHAPRTCKNFAELAGRDFYNGTIFHRIIAGFMIQGGDPTGTGRGGTSIYGQTFNDEIDTRLKHTGAAPTQHLDGKHTIFGRVCKGMKTVQKIGIVNTDNNDRPLYEVKIFSATPIDNMDD
ncbi:Peptidyl-prolyl cis-trans isomerase-like 1 [Strongyloides ratti]|uniref:Peptidyl-prolyl cis-trans isomerase n=1 Tax=Strongyloides ratti TaxID=34506 RepID=A0A090LDV1_STRRB|nr:Peptidyl-prolyl cis-trans isomerase-like 1 [Strongyloides ratti]CEF66308.1 Peptidyl-prolyl cis-trans isomerase-like 1 [Strongyloides ratti]